MAFKTASVVMAPDGDPKKHRASIKTSKIEILVVVIELMNIDQAVNICKDLVDKEGVQAISLCPGFTHAAVARIATAVGEGVSISVARGDVPSVMITGGILGQEEWF